MKDGLWCTSVPLFAAWAGVEVDVSLSLHHQHGLVTGPAHPDDLGGVEGCPDLGGGGALRGRQGGHGQHVALAEHGLRRHVSQVQQWGTD